MQAQPQKKVADDAGPKTKEADPKSGKEATGEDLTMKTFQMLLESERQTLEIVIGSNKKGNGMTEEEKLDQEDQRIKEVELGMLEKPKENASIACGDWIHRIRSVICNLSKRAKMCWT